MLEKQNLLGLTQSKFKDFFSDLSEKPFRTKQIMQWIYHQGVHDFGDMHNFSKDLRDKLGSIASLELPEVVSMNNSCLLYTSPSPRDRTRSRMPSSA